MAYKIIASQCTSCSACEAECPNVAIREKNGTYHHRSEEVHRVHRPFRLAAMRRRLSGRRTPA